MNVAVSQSVSLLLLFVVLPFVVGAVVMSLVARRSPATRPGTRTSEILAQGQDAQAEIVDRRTAGGFLDPRPMVHFLLRLDSADEAGVELTVTQSIPRRLLPELQPGAVVRVRLSQDRTVGAIVLP